MSTVRKQLGQLRPADTNAASIYSPAANVTTIIEAILIVNTTGTAATFRIFLDDNGTTYTEATALRWEESLEPNSSIRVGFQLPMSDSDGNLAIRSGTGSALTFTVFGTETT